MSSSTMKAPTDIRRDVKAELSSGELGTAVSELVNDGVVVASSVLLIGSFFWVPAWLWHVWRRRCKTRRRKALFLGCVLVVLLSPLPTNRRITRLALWDRFWRYFSGRVVGHVEGTNERQAIFCLIPHGIFPFGIGLSSLGSFNKTAFKNLRPVVASIMAHVPVIGHILRLLGAVKASAREMDNALKAGYSLGLAPGGIGEIFLDGDAGRELALLKHHKGFIRRAMAHGVPLVPVYVFGNSMTFRRAALPKVLEKLSRLLKVSLVIFWGRWGLPVPFKVPITFAIGEMLHVDKNTSPSSQEVNALHARFCQALADLFDRHKHEHGWGNKLLELR